MRIIGINDDRDCCECCGKKGLKRVVWLETDSGDIAHYGTDCAAAALLGRKSRKNGAIVTHQAQAVQMIRNMLSAGAHADKIADTVIRRFGYAAEAKNGAVHIWLQNPGIPEVFA